MFCGREESFVLDEAGGRVYNRENAKERKLPVDATKKTGPDAVLVDGACHVLNIRPQGGVEGEAGE